MEAQAGSSGSGRGGGGGGAADGHSIRRWKGTVTTTLGQLPLELIQTCGHPSSQLLSAWKDKAAVGEGSGVPEPEETSSLSHVCNRD